MSKPAMGLLIYWLLGCFIVGQAAGMDAVDCPLDHGWKPADMAAMVAIWPVVFGYVLRNPHSTTRCDAP